MCELFGVSSNRVIDINPLLKEFLTHSVNHPHGWGIATLADSFVSIEKEPVQATKSMYLKERLSHKMEVKDMIAHIRFATKGSVDYVNSHPFSGRDQSGRMWVLAHNGTVFDCPVLSPYFYQQQGQTDSERILLYMIDCVNERQKELGRALDFQERFSLLENLVAEISCRNKVNLLFYDGEAIYVHTNYRDSLYVYETEAAAYFSTQPLQRGNWRRLPFTALCAYRDGREIMRGNIHGNEYIDNAADVEYLFTDFSGL